MLRIIHCGLGYAGKEIVRQIYKKEGMELVGCVDIDPVLVGKDVGEVIGIGKTDIIISDEYESVFTKAADVLTDASGTMLRHVYPHIKKALESGFNVVTLSEELAWPLNETELAQELDNIAKQNYVTLVSGGPEPGFNIELMVYLTRACLQVRKLRQHRVWDIAEYVKLTSKEQSGAFGIGVPIDECRRMVEEGEIPLHVGLYENMHQIAHALGWRLDRIEKKQLPLESKIVRKMSPDFIIEKDETFGCTSEAVGINSEGERVIEITGIIACSPTKETDGFEPGLTIEIEGEPNLKMELDGIQTSENIVTVVAACLVNWIPYVVRARSGLLTDIREFPVIPCAPII